MSQVEIYSDVEPKEPGKYFFKYRDHPEVNIAELWKGGWYYCSVRHESDSFRKLVLFGPRVLGPREAARYAFLMTHCVEFLDMSHHTIDMKPIPQWRASLHGFGWQQGETREQAIDELMKVIQERKQSNGAG